MDAFHGLVNSLSHRTLSVNLGKYPESRNRTCCGDRQCWRGEFSHPHLCVGLPSDRFQYQQSGTTAAAIDKLHTCEGYLAVHSDEAGRRLCPKFASGSETGTSKYVCLVHFSDAAHGSEFSHTNELERQKFLGKAKREDPKVLCLSLWSSRSVPRMCTSCFSNRIIISAFFSRKSLRPNQRACATLLVFSFDAYENPSGFFETLVRARACSVWTLCACCQGPVFRNQRAPRKQCS